MKRRGTGAAGSPSPWRWFLLAVLVIGLVGGGGALIKSISPKPPQQSLTMPAGYPPEPDWVKNALQPVREAYIYAANHHEELQYIPCYCGCGAIHGSNSACYFTRDAEGAPTGFDMHAYG